VLIIWFNFEAGDKLSPSSLRRSWNDSGDPGSLKVNPHIVIPCGLTLSMETCELHGRNSCNMIDLLAQTGEFTRANQSKDQNLPEQRSEFAWFEFPEVNPHIVIPCGLTL